MKKLLRNFAAGAAFALGALAIALAVPPIYANTLQVFTQPGAGNPLGGLSGNPANQPQNQGDYNAIINAVNANAAFAGTGTPSLAIGVNATSTTGVFPTAGQTTSLNLLQFFGAITTTTSTTNNGINCNITSATQCLRILDLTGTPHWLGIYQ